LNRVQDRLTASMDDVGMAMKDLLSTLSSIKFGVTPEVWEQVVSQCMGHPIHALIDQDPFTARSFRKPRGYPGDAVLIDFIYTRDAHFGSDEVVSELGERIFEFTRDTPPCRAVRARRDIMATIIDSVSDEVSQPSILSVACGHLREAMLSRAVPEGRVGRFVALDQDELSLKVVEEQAGGFGVVPVCNSIKALFRSSLAHEKFDLVYSTGLYDYLDERLATKLTHRMFEMLKPKGRLVIANFLPNLWGSGYMETYMGWHLIYRTAEQMVGLCSTIDPLEINSSRTWTEENENIVFLELTRQ
jgi:extracellular factor (EF) 3-hydroxypalmitic acid methyl ester biosynthesis protein